MQSVYYRGNANFLFAISVVLGLFIVLCYFCLRNMTEQERKTERQRKKGKEEKEEKIKERKEGKERVKEREKQR